MTDDPRAVGADSVRAGYSAHGVDGYYARYGDRYRNPHEAVIVEAIHIAHGRAPLPAGRVLDLACGSGEATVALQSLPDAPRRTVLGCDPYTADAWRARVGLPVIELDFAAIAAGALDPHGPFDLIVCSFALHLAERSRLPGVLWALSRAGRELLLLSPHKRPHIGLGFEQIDRFEHRRVRVRRFVRA